MNQLNFNTEKRNFKHLSEYERGEIYARKRKNKTRKL